MKFLWNIQPTIIGNGNEYIGYKTPQTNNNRSFHCYTPDPKSSTMLVVFSSRKSSICWKIGIKTHLILRMYNSFITYVVRKLIACMPSFIKQCIQQNVRLRQNIHKIQYNGFSKRCSRVCISPKLHARGNHFSVLCHRTLRREPGLTQFETAQIANLCPATAEEAKSIIPRSAQSSLFIYWGGWASQRQHHLTVLSKLTIINYNLCLTKFKQ